MSSAADETELNKRGEQARELLEQFVAAAAHQFNSTGNGYLWTGRWLSWRAALSAANMKAAMDIGDSWAYRARAKDPLVEVRIVRMGVRKPPRVLVHFADDVFEGKQEWVPPARLKVPWQDRDEFTAREKRWDAVADPGSETRPRNVLQEWYSTCGRANGSGTHLQGAWCLPHQGSQRSSCASRP